MTGTPRYLITTADERTWKFDRPVLFLGEWCRLYDRKQIWEGMDAVVAKPYGLQAGQKGRDLAYVQALSSRLLDELADALNVFHETRYSVRYWHILLGHWIDRFGSVTFNRYFTLERALKDHEISGTTVFDSSAYSLATTDLLTFIYACNDDVWNHVLYSRILNCLGSAKTETNNECLHGISGFSQANEKTERARNVKKFIRRSAIFIFSKLKRKRDAFIIGSSLPLKQEIKLQLSLGQCPQLWEKPRPNLVAPNPGRRRQFSLNAGNHQGFERFVRLLLAEVIPSCYLEGYRELAQQVRSLPWPDEPKFIFTTSNFFTDEIFKAWTASRVEHGTPYFIGQHGNNYGTLLGSQCWPELVTCDRAFTWGWTNGSPKNIPAFVFKLAGRKSQPTSPNGGLLLIELHPPQLITTWDDHVEFGAYQEEQFRFAASLPERIQKQLTVRLHAEYKKHRWSDEQRWRDRNPHATVETGIMRIKALIAQSRLVVHSYDSTGILETLALNVPTLCFWRGGLDHLLPSAKPYYELLRGAGILVDTPEQAAQMVALHWNDVSEWWESKNVENARKGFCEQYAKTEKDPIRTLKRLLTT